MKSSGRKLLAFSMAGAMLFSLSACKGGAKKQNIGAYVPNNDTQYTITTTQSTAWAVNSDGDLLKRWDDKFNVKITVINLDPKNATEQLNLKVASGDIPDVFSVNAVTLNNYQPQGALAEIPDDVMHKYLPNATKKLEEEYPGALKYGYFGSKRYGIVNSLQNSNFYRTPIIYNGVWMKKLGISKAPTTLSELEDMMYKFANNDPDGNGKKDTYGLSASAMQVVYGAYGTALTFSSGKMNGGIWLDKNGKAVYSSIQPEMKEALTILNKWYKDGVLDPQFITGENTGGESAITQAFINSRIGLTSQSAFKYWNPPLPGRGAGNDYKELAKTNTELADNLVFGLPVKGPDGKGGVIYQPDPLNNSYLVFGSQLAKQPDKMAKIMQIADYVNATFTDDAAWTNTYGIKGKDWDYNTDGTLKQITPSDQITPRGGFAALGFFSFANKDSFVIKPQTDWAVKNNFDKGGLKSILPSVVNIPSIAQYQASLQKLESTAFISIVTGDKPLSYFDTFVSEWKSQGGDQITKDVNAWYSSMNKK